MDDEVGRSNYSRKKRPGTTYTPLALKPFYNVQHGYIYFYIKRSTKNMSLSAQTTNCTFIVIDRFSSCRTVTDRQINCNSEEFAILRPKS